MGCDRVRRRVDSRGRRVSPVDSVTRALSDGSPQFAGTLNVRVRNSAVASSARNQVALRKKP